MASKYFGVFDVHGRPVALYRTPRDEGRVPDGATELPDVTAYAELLQKQGRKFWHAATSTVEDTPETPIPPPPVTDESVRRDADQRMERASIALRLYELELLAIDLGSTSITATTIPRARARRIAEHAVELLRQRARIGTVPPDQIVLPEEPSS